MSFLKGSRMHNLSPSAAHGEEYNYDGSTASNLYVKFTVKYLDLEHFECFKDNFRIAINLPEYDEFLVCKSSQNNYLQEDNSAYNRKMQAHKDFFLNSDTSYDSREKTCLSNQSCIFTEETGKTSSIDPLSWSSNTLRGARTYSIEHSFDYSQAIHHSDSSVSPQVQDEHAKFPLKHFSTREKMPSRSASYSNTNMTDTDDDDEALEVELLGRMSEIESDCDVTSDIEAELLGTLPVSDCDDLDISTDPFLCGEVNQQVIIEKNNNLPVISNDNALLNCDSEDTDITNEAAPNMEPVSDDQLGKSCSGYSLETSMDKKRNVHDHCKDVGNTAEGSDYPTIIPLITDADDIATINNKSHCFENPFEFSSTNTTVLKDENENSDPTTLNEGRNGVDQTVHLITEKQCTERQPCDNPNNVCISDQMEHTDKSASLTQKDDTENGSVDSNDLGSGKIDDISKYCSQRTTASPQHSPVYSDTILPCQSSVLSSSDNVHTDSEVDIINSPASLMDRTTSDDDGYYMVLSSVGDEPSTEESIFDEGREFILFTKNGSITFENIDLPSDTSSAAEDTKQVYPVSQTKITDPVAPQNIDKVMEIKVEGGKINDKSVCPVQINNVIKDDVKLRAKNRRFSGESVKEAGEEIMENRGEVEYFPSTKRSHAEISDGNDSNSDSDYDEKRRNIRLCSERFGKEESLDKDIRPQSRYLKQPSLFQKTNPHDCKINKTESKLPPTECATTVSNDNAINENKIKREFSQEDKFRFYSTLSIEQEDCRESTTLRLTNKSACETAPDTNRDKYSSFKSLQPGRGTKDSRPQQTATKASSHPSKAVVVKKEVILAEK